MAYVYHPISTLYRLALQSETYPLYGQGHGYRGTSCIAAMPKLNSQERHPMRPHRLELTNQLVLGYGLHDHMTMHAPRKATEDELRTFHDADYIDFLKR